MKYQAAIIAGLAISLAHCQYYGSISWGGTSFVGPTVANWYAPTLHYSGQAAPDYGNGAMADVIYNDENRYVLNGRINAYIIYYRVSSDLDYPAIVTTFINNIHSSSWFNVVRKYYNKANRPSKVTQQHPDSLQLKASATFDCTWGWTGKSTSTSCTQITGKQIRQIVDHVSGNPQSFPGFARDGRAMYFFILSPSISETADGNNYMGKDYCAYHSSFQSSNYGPWLKYVVVKIPKLDSKCDFLRGLTTGNGRQIDNLLYFMGHEISEKITNTDAISPYVENSWYDKNNLEIADKCAAVIPEIKDNSGFKYNVNIWTPTGRIYTILPAVYDFKQKRCSMGDTRRFMIVFNDGGLNRAVKSSSTDGSQVQVVKYDRLDSTQKFHMNGANSGPIRNQASGKCFSVSSISNNDAVRVEVRPCVDGSQNQSFVWDPSTYTIRIPGESRKCIRLTEWSTLVYYWCDGQYGTDKFNFIPVEA